MDSKGNASFLQNTLTDSSSNYTPVRWTYYRKNISELPRYIIIFPYINEMETKQLRACAYQRVINFPRNLENLASFLFLQHPFWDSTFCLIADEMLFSQKLFSCQFLNVVARFRQASKDIYFYFSWRVWWIFYNTGLGELLQIAH